ncbi:hypothetical protein CPB84DRAFT_1795481 [Gymnopilus junonius]|uniref:Uncharacterized protein n=1 Tax=Gymnopilus junonius TaxID=109634 RepID=A0A9P5NDC0_GYMJU|nr:hypothetical protein CPB84DRAFT_1795481 [Gymnopilus junonius]
MKNLPLDLVFLWRRIDTQKDDEPPAGRNCLTKLAIRILSIIANSAGLQDAMQQPDCFQHERSASLESWT